MSPRSARQPYSEAEIVRLQVLGAISRGMRFSYAARTAGISIEQVQELADAAGWPDVPAVTAMYEELRAAGSWASTKGHTEPASPVVRLQPVDPQPVRPKPAPPRLDLSVARIPPPVPLAPVPLAADSTLDEELTQYFAEVDEVIGAITDKEVEERLGKLLAEAVTDASVARDMTGDAVAPADPIGDIRKAADLLLGERPISAQLNQNLAERAEQEYFGEVVQTGPTPEQGERLEDYVARVAAPIEASLTAELGVPGARVEFDTTPILEFDPDRVETYSCAQPGGDCGCTGTGLISCPGRSLIEEDARPDSWPIGEAWPDAPDPSGDLIDCEPLVVSPLVSAAPDEIPQPPTKNFIGDQGPEARPVELNPGVDLGPLLPPAGTVKALKAVKRSATRAPGTLPCEVCGRGVTLEYVAANDGIQKHGHCRAGS